MPPEIELGQLISRFGAQAVYGRTLGIGEMRRIGLAERVAFVCRKWLSPTSGQWFAAHPEDNVLLAWAVEAYKHG